MLYMIDRSVSTGSDLCDTVGVTQFYGMNEKFTFRRWGARCQMRGGAALLSFALLALSAFAGQRVVVPQLPTPVRPLAEVGTNVVFATGAATDNKWTLTIERDAATSNSVEVVFGCDANEDGVLGIEEGELSIGWDCGEWFWRDRRTASTIFYHSRCCCRWRSRGTVSC